MSLNLHAIAGPLVGTVNANVVATVRLAQGYTTLPTGQQIASYDDVAVTAQVQALSGGDLRQLDSLNIQGVKRVAYLYPNVQGLVRPNRKGGDLLVFGADVVTLLGLESATWLVTVVLETWPGWCKVGLTLQNGS